QRRRAHRGDRRDGRDHQPAARRARHARGAARHDQPGRRVRRHRPDARDVQEAAGPARGRRVTLLPTPVAAFGYLPAASCFIVAIKGLPSPRPARRGNLTGAGGPALPLAVLLLSPECVGATVAILLVTLAAGAVVPVPVARRVAITGMPQL